MKNINEITQWALGEYKKQQVYVGHGTESAEDEVLFLCLCALGLDYSVDESILQKELSESEVETIKVLIEKRVTERKPAAYLVNKAYFCGLEFYVDERTLVPRSPIAELIEQRFEPFCDAESVTHVLDLCTGSGCIAIACAYAFPSAAVDASDLSPDAVEVAQRNVELHQKNVTLYQSDVFDQIPEKQYDIIVSNPPYVSHEEMQTVPDEFNQEPLMGLEAPDEGLAVVFKVLKDAKRYLKPGGILVIEVGNSEEALVRRMPDVPFIWLEFEYGGSGVFLLKYEDLAIINSQAMSSRPLR